MEFDAFDWGDSGLSQSQVLAAQDAEFGVQQNYQTDANLSGLYSGPYEGIVSNNQTIAEQDNAIFGDTSAGLPDATTDLATLIAAQQREDAAAGGDTGGISKTVSDLLKSMDNKTVAALITAGAGMLSGASKGKMTEKQWKREDDMLATQRARQDAFSKPGRVYSMNFKPQATGLLSSVKK